MASNSVLVMILAGGKGRRLFPLTETRCKPSVLFGGNFMLIDFTLSNCINSGFMDINILTQYKSDSIERHINRWKNNHKDLSICYNINTVNSAGTSQFEGTADAVRQNIQTIHEKNPEHIMILSSDHVYRMDYSKMLEVHKNNNAEVTIGAIESGITEAASFGVIEADKTDRITGFLEKPENPKPIIGKPDSAYISMGMRSKDCI